MSRKLDVTHNQVMGALGSRSLPRRSLLWGGISAASLGALAACGGSDTTTPQSTAQGSEAQKPATGPVELTLWDWVPKVYDAQVKAYMKAHPNVTIKSVTVPGGGDGGYQKMFSALKAGNAPDIAEVEFQVIPQFLLGGNLVNIKDQVQQYQDKFVDWQWKQCSYGDGVYAIPHDSGPMALYYRKDLLGKLGIDPPSTWDDFAAAAETIKKKDAKGAICTFAPGSPDFFTAMAWQAGAQWFTTEGDTWVVNMTDSATKKVADYWQELVDNKVVKTENYQTAFWKDMQDGHLLTMPGASWHDHHIRDQAANTKGKWRVADLPQWGSQFASANWGGSTLAVLKGSKNAATAADVCAWIGSSPKSLGVQIDNGVFPSVADLSNVKAASKPASEPFYGGQNILDTFEKANKGVNEAWGWPPVTTTMYDALTKHFAEVISTKSGNLFTAVQKAQDDTVAAIKQQGLSVSTG